MNLFQEEVLKEFPEFQQFNDPFGCFTEDVQAVVESFGILPHPNCKINSIFVGTNDERYNKLEYCLRNCGFKCLR